MPSIVSHIAWEKKAGRWLTDGSVWYGVLGREEANAILSDECISLIECYIGEKHLRELADANDTAPEDLLRDQFLPDAPHMRSGDAGEILARDILQGWRECPSFPALRWRSRANKNDTVRGPDLLGYVLVDASEENEHDLLVVCEVKTRASRPDKTIVAQAFGDARKHYVSRLANSLFFIQRLLLAQGNEQAARSFARFTKPHSAPYLRRVTPIVVHDQGIWSDVFFDELPDEHGLEDEVELIVVVVPDLADWIDQVYRGAVAHVRDEDAVSA